MKTKKTTITISPELRKRLKILAVNYEITIEKVVELLLNKHDKPKVRL